MIVGSVSMIPRRDPIRYGQRDPDDLLEHLHIRIVFVLSGLDLANVHAEGGFDTIALHSSTC